VLVAVLGCFICAPAIVHGQIAPTTQDSPILLKGRHGITIHAGFLNQATTEASVAGGSVDSEVRTTGFLGSLSYAYWVGSEWSIGLSVGLISAEVGTSVAAGTVNSEAAAVVPFLFTVAYHPAELALSRTLRPYGSVAVGPYRGSATNTSVGATIASESVSEAVIGFRAQAGIDWFLGKMFRAGMALGYHFVGDFEEPIGRDNNYSGPEFLIGFGILLGRGR
jgi:hypothetical protein